MLSVNVASSLIPVRSLCWTFSLVLVAFIVHGHFAQHDTSCNRLLRDAKLSGAASDQDPSWQVPGCLMRMYTPQEATMCLNSRRIVIVGDSTARQTYWALLHMLGSDSSAKPIARHSDVFRTIDDIQLHFLWDPYLNASLTTDLAPPSQGDTSLLHDISARHTVFIIGAGLWHARFDRVGGSDHFVAALGKLVGKIDGWLSNSGSMSTDGSLAFLLPVQVPHYQWLSPERQSTFDFDAMHDMNEKLFSIATTYVPVVSAFQHFSDNNFSTFTDDGLHVRPEIARGQANLLLNAMCNQRVQLLKGYPHERKCCSHGGPSTFGVMTFVSSVTVLGYLCLALFRQLQSCGAFFEAFVPIIFVLNYCWLADRSSFMSVRKKVVDIMLFNYMTGAVTSLGFIGTSTLPKVSDMAHGSSQEALELTEFQPIFPPLSRHLTDEWKGWMQFAILLYHYTGGSKVLAIYQPIRVMVASYLFLTGYGHTTFFIRRRDYSLRRITAILLRLNVVSCMLTYIMGTEYTFYYFAPLCSFWTLTVYITLRLREEANKRDVVVYIKIVGAALITYLLIKPAFVLDTLVKLLRYTCNVHWSTREMRFRLGLDPFIVYAGMLYALHTLLRTPQPQPPTRQASLSLFNRVSGSSLTLSITATIVLVSYFLLSYHHLPSKQLYNSVHPFTSIVPILAYIVLRTHLPVVRSRYSRVFAWLGRCSLETFTLQSHIWLAGDTHLLLGLPVVGGARPRALPQPVEFVVLTLIFLYTSWAVAGCTSKIVAWFVGTASAEVIAECEPMELRCRTGTPVNHRPEGTGITATNSRVRAAMARVQRTVRGSMADLRLRIVLLFLVMWVLNWIPEPYPYTAHPAADRGEPIEA